ncbi:MAG: hypothetical protein HZB29_07350 [Nitrospinae bacterium]|nr:hypothetical protein [Nitrospinota bacterium]
MAVLSEIEVNGASVAGAGVKVKAIGLLSGGLDSNLATRIMQRLGFDVTALNFMSPFCTCTRKDHGCKNEAKRLAEELGIPVRVEFMGKEYIGLVRNPKFGYGKNINPCVDCRIMIFRRAKQIMEETGAAFIFTGEVAGQRMMSQKIDRMRMIEKEAGLDGLVVRPLCAKLLPPTVPELNGTLDREQMLAIHGRSRKEQVRIAKEEFGMTDNLCSSGGCLLTDQHFANRMRDLLDNDVEAGVKDARLLRLGRHFRVSPEVKLVVGRDEEENKRLMRMAGDEDFIFYAAEVNGPLAVAKGKLSRESIGVIGGVTARYCDAKDAPSVKIEYKKKKEAAAWTIEAAPADEESLSRMRL